MLVERGAHYGEKKIPFLLRDLGLDVETGATEGNPLGDARFRIPVLHGEGPFDPDAVLPPPATPPLGGTGAGAAAGGTGSRALRREASAAAAAAAAAEEEEEEESSEEEAGPLLLAPPPGLDYPLFAYLRESVGNEPVAACKGCDCRGNCATNPDCACRRKSQDGTGPYTQEGLLKWPAPVCVLFVCVCI